MYSLPYSFYSLWRRKVFITRSIRASRLAAITLNDADSLELHIKGRPPDVQKKRESCCAPLVVLDFLHLITSQVAASPTSLVTPLRHHCNTICSSGNKREKSDKKKQDERKFKLLPKLLKEPLFESLQTNVGSRVINDFMTLQTSCAFKKSDLFDLLERVKLSKIISCVTLVVLEGQIDIKKT